jgi:ABC-type antimicrobial peptide transport system permease subunit
VLRTILGRVAVLVSAGSLAGLLLGLASGSVLANVVYQASPRDPLTLAAVAIIMLVVALASGLGPIRRAISGEPLQSLRQE